MKAIMVMFDSLNRHMLPPYGCDWIRAPNFQRLAQKTVTFDNCYIGSAPCIPARRELHTGRYNFLHRSWGPIEPFDDSMPGLLKENGVYTHLVTDHYHYWEYQGGGYLDQYSTWEIARGQEGDCWKGQVENPEIPETLSHRAPEQFPRLWRQDWVNRGYMPTEEDYPQAKTFAMGLDFIKTNAEQDNWFLQIEAFDPHEPYFAPQKYKDLYPHNYDGPHFDWPNYDPVTESPEQIEHCRYEYAALVSMCDEYLGKVLDLMDELDMWQDTMLIVNTDHGFLFSEHGWWGKNAMPWYNELAHIPLFIWDPRSGKTAERRNALVQTIDLPPTLLEFFDVDIPKDMQGQPLKDAISADKPVREAALFGVHSGHVNCTDGRYVYMRGPANSTNTPLFEYTLMPVKMPPDQLQTIELADPFSFTKGSKVMQITPLRHWVAPQDFGTLLFDLDEDMAQENPVNDHAVEEMMTKHLIKLMKESDTPPEQFERLGLN